MSQILKTSLLIVGGGPGGYVAAIRAGQLGIPPYWWRAPPSAAPA